MALKDGRVVEARVDNARPARRDAIIQKFRANAGRALPPARVGELEGALLELDRAASVVSLLRLCRA